ncbi:MAG: metal-dependent transcriptional regulator [Phycisphaeraceae bacterium]
MPSVTVEDYLKQIYLEQQSAPGGLVSMGRLAEVMHVVPGTATAMVKSLAESGLVSYEPRSGVRLSRGGERLALGVVRRHRLVELFLVRTLGMDWSEVHDEAERLEHAISDKVLPAIDRTLGYPQFDPHGDPIPPAHGRPAATSAGALVSLSDCRAGDQVRVSRIMDQDAAFLQFADRHGLTPGTTLTVDANDTVADALTVRDGDGRSLTLGASAAGKIQVEPG